MDKSQAIDQFVKNVREITDSDYGDFMRKSNTYLNRLLEQYSKVNEKEKEILLKMKTRIQYSPSRNLDETSMLITDLAENLKKL